MTSNVKTKKMIVKVSFIFAVIGIFVISSLMVNPSNTAIAQMQPQQQ
jgi:hypothetical protein